MSDLITPLLELLLSDAAPSRAQGVELLQSLPLVMRLKVLSLLQRWSALPLDGLDAPGVRVPRSLTNVNLRAAVLREARLHGCTVQAVQLHASDLAGGDLSASHLIGVGLCSGVLRGADLSSSCWEVVSAGEADLSGAHAPDWQLRDVSLPLARLADVHAPALDAPGVDLRGAVLQRAVLTDAVLCGADLRESDLRDADLRGADLSFADLRGAVLDGADTEGACFDSALLDHPRPGGLILAPGCLLQGRILAGQDLSGADLRGANLRGADLRQALLKGAQLEGADMRDVIESPGGRVPRPSRADSDLTGLDLRGGVVSATNVRTSYSMGFWFNPQTMGASAALLRSRGGICAPSRWRVSHRPRTGWPSQRPPAWLLEAEAVPLLPGMLLWVKQGSGRWSRRVRSVLGDVVDTSPPPLSHAVADLTDLSTWDMALLWLALSLGYPEDCVPDELTLSYQQGQWCIQSRGDIDYWNYPVPVALDADAMPGRVLAQAWSWRASAVALPREDAGTIMSNPWPPSLSIPESPEEHLAQYLEALEHVRAERLQRQRAALLARWVSKRGL